MNKETIEPKYADFDTAKWLKEKTFDEECSHFYTPPNCKMLGIDEHGRYYPIKNKPKALWIVGNAATLNYKNVIFAPEQWQVIEWLRINHGIWVQVFIQFENVVEDECEETLEYGYGIYNFKEMRKIGQNVFPYVHIDDVDNHVFGFNSPQEAYQASFDYIRLNNLI